MLYYIYTTKLAVFLTVVGIAAVVLTVELLYFEHDSFADGVRVLERHL